MTYSTSFREFLATSDCKIARLLYRADRRSHVHNAWNLLVTNEQIDYLTFRVDGTISYLPSGKEHKYTDTGEWSREGRQFGKAAKVIRKLFTKNGLKLFKDSDFECFSNNYKAAFSGEDLKFELLPHSRIPSVYNSRICEGDGSLQNSCMNGDGGYLAIYKYCTKLSILTLTNKDNKLVGRALVWKLDDEITLLDRVYVTSDYQYDLFINYAKANKYWYKKHFKSYDYRTIFIDPSGKEAIRNFTVYTDTDFDSYPYIDTFCFGSDGSLNNYGDGCYEYHDTGGDRTGESHANEVYDDIDDRYIPEDEAIVIERGEYRRRTTHVDNTVDVQGYIYWHEDTSIHLVNGDYYHEDDLVYSEYHGEYIVYDDAIEINGDWYYEGDDEGDVYVEIEGKYYIIDDGDVVEIDGEWYLKTSDEIVEIDDDWYLKTSDEVVEIDGEYYLTDSDDVILIEDTYYLKTDYRLIEISYDNYQLRQLSFNF